MPQTDFLLRQIEQMSQALAALIRRLLGLNINVEEKEIQEVIDAFLKDKLNTSMENLLKITPAKIPEFIAQNKEFDEANLELFADVMVLNAKANKKLADKEKLFRMALEIYFRINKQSRTFSMERQNKIQEVENQLSTF